MSLSELHCGKEKVCERSYLLGSNNIFTHLNIHIYMYSFYFSDNENRTGQDFGSDVTVKRVRVCQMESGTTTTSALHLSELISKMS